MYIRVFKEDVLEGLQKAASIIPARSGAAYLRSIWLKASKDSLQILATDSSIEFTGNYVAVVENAGLAGVQGRTFVDLIKQLSPGQITIQTDEKSGTLIIEQNKRKYKLPTNDTVWFQNFSEFPESDDDPVMWSGDFIQEMIDKVGFCISDDEAKDSISCLCLKPSSDNKIDSCGLNGHQFALVRFMHDDLRSRLPEEGTLIQKKYLTELKKWLSDSEVDLSIHENRLFFRTNDKKEIFSLPVSGYQYPEYNNFMSKLNDDNVSKLTIERKELTEALDRLQLFNSESNRCTYFDFSSSEGEVILSSNGQDTGSATEVIEITYEGSLKKIAFPTKNMIEIINHFTSKKLNLIMSGSEGPCGISGDEDPDYIVIIMPMKIVDETFYSEETV